MAGKTPLRISCQCPDDAISEDCLVHFFLAERTASVLQLTAPPAPPVVPLPSDLPGDLAGAFAALEGAGFEPQLIDVRDRGAMRAS
jgi:hypothetical protein